MIYSICEHCGLRKFSAHKRNNNKCLCNECWFSHPFSYLANKKSKESTDENFHRPLELMNIGAKISNAPDAKYCHGCQSWRQPIDFDENIDLSPSLTEALGNLVWCRECITKARTEGLTYCVADAFGLIKIGRVSSGYRYHARLSAHQCSHSDSLLPLVVLPGKKTEKELHKRFSHLRRLREWFLCEDELLEFLGTAGVNEDTLDALRLKRTFFRVSEDGTVSHIFDYERYVRLANICQEIGPELVEALLTRLQRVDISFQFEDAGTVLEQIGIDQFEEWGNTLFAEWYICAILDTWKVLLHLIPETKVLTPEILFKMRPLSLGDTTGCFVERFNDEEEIISRQTVA